MGFFERKPERERALETAFRHGIISQDEYAIRLHEIHRERENAKNVT